MDNSGWLSAHDPEPSENIIWDTREWGIKATVAQGYNGISPFLRFRKVIINAMAFPLYVNTTNVKIAKKLYIIECHSLRTHPL